MTRSTVLVVEDDRKTIELVSMYLKRDGRSLHTAVTVSMVFRLRAEAEIAEFEERTDEIQLVRMEHWLLGYHSSAGGWHDLQDFIEEMGVLYGQHILVEDARGTLIGNSQPLLEEQTGLTDWITVPLHSHGSDERIGTLFVSSAPGIRTTLRRGLRESLTDIAMWGSLLAAAIAIPLSILLGRPIVRSVSHLVVAAERFGSGDFSTRSPAPATRELRSLAAEEGTEVSLFFQQNVDEVCVLPVDRRRMTQVLTNLLNNAIQYCPPRSTIAVRAGARGDGGGARFRIWLPDQQRERSRAR